VSTSIVSALPSMTDVCWPSAISRTNLTLYWGSWNPLAFARLVQFLTGEATFVEYDELEILIALGTGDLVIISEYSDGRLVIDR
jgi:hypothetical protein